MRPHQSSGARAKLLLPPTLLLLLVVSVVPARWSAWVGELSRFVTIAVAPISSQVIAIARSVQPAPDPPSSKELQLLEEQKQAFETLYLRERDENQRLRDYITELQQGFALNPDARVQQVIAPVIGTSRDLSSGLLLVKSGVGVPVDNNTTATTTGLQLVGRVQSTSGPSCWLLPITRKGIGKLQVAIMTGEGAPVIGSNLVPTGDGRLRGDVMRISGPLDQPPPPPDVGQIVRLADDEWPPSARMLIVGKVESVTPSPDDPLRATVTVKPLVNVERVSEVILRVPSAPEAPR